MEPAERVLEASDGTTLRVRLVRAAAPKGCVIVVHGLDDHLERYSHLEQFLHEAGYDVALYDQRGHGASGGERTHVASFSEYVSDLEQVRALVQPAGAWAPHLFGHSMGSAIALVAAMRHPERWRSVIVQGFPVLPGRNIPKVLEMLAAVLRPLISGLRVPSGLDAEALSHDAEAVEDYQQDPNVKGDVTLSWGLEFLAALRELRDGAAAITCPLLILHGADDSIALAEGSRWLAGSAGAQDKKLVVFPGLKHELHNELPGERDRVFAEIGEWLARH
jgi:alpha-beta hydrolase superfamily lysophospholipase